MGLCPTAPRGLSVLDPFAGKLRFPERIFTVFCPDEDIENLH